MTMLMLISVTFGIRYEAGVNDTLEGRWIIQTSDGGYAVVGTWRSSGQHDIFLLKTDANGNIQWVKTYGGSNQDWGDFVSQTSDGGYIIGGSTRSWGAGDWDIFIIKTDASGNVQWARAFGGPDGNCSTCLSNYRVEFARSVVELPSGGYLVNGTVDEPFPVTTYYYGIYTMRLDASGNLVSFRTIEKGYYAGYGFPDVLYRLPDGNYIFCATIYWDDYDWWDGLIYKKVLAHAYLHPMGV